ncbi:hypothetical protein [Gallibacterium anatis]|uniref:hypothetical protein n=1 Tax=Gallibacterium anatis TaxID=750 RepID=UPI001B3269CD|nr:hypothetical protein [Gallibacterium anatis]MBP4133455.1 hypothetical protein [Gallibacterium anatis]
MKLLNKSILFGLSFILAACNSSGGGNSSQKDNAVVINPVQDEQQDGINSSTENNTSHNKSSKEDKQSVENKQEKKEPSFKPSKAEGDVFTFVGIDGSFEERPKSIKLSFDKTANPVSDIGYYGYFTMPEIPDDNSKYYFYEVDQKYVLENPNQDINAIYKGLAKMTIDGQEKDGSLTLELKDQTVSGNIEVQANNIKQIELKNATLGDTGYIGNAVAAEYKGKYEGVFAGKEDKAENTLGVFYLKKEGEPVISGAYQAKKQ